MSGETSTVSHLFDVMSTDQGGITETTGENGLASSSSNGALFYFELFVVVIGVVGAAANGLVLYAMVASKQHKKHVLIVNQNALDLYSCLLLVIVYGLKRGNMHLSGSLGYWLCMLLYGESLLFGGIFSSWVNLMIITIERYLKIVHSKWSKKKLRKWMTYMAIACTWIIGFIHELTVAFETTAVIGGACYVYANLIPASRMPLAIYYFFFTYVIVLVIFTFCYVKILMVIHRQARVMASHNAGESSAAQAPLNKIQTNVIKTMIFVCAFYAIAWLPEKIFILLMGLDPNLTFVDGYYVTLFVGFLYICANPFIYALKFDPVRRILKGLILCQEVPEPADSGMQLT